MTDTITLPRAVIEQTIDALTDLNNGLVVYNGEWHTRQHVATSRLRAALAQQAEPTFDGFDGFEKYLKEGETPLQRLEREIKDGRALMKIYGKALAQIQELQAKQDTPVAFYEIAHDEDGEVEYGFSVYLRPGFKPLFAQSAPQVAQQAEQVRKPNCAECAKWAKEQADDKEWHGSVARGREIVSRMAAAPNGVV